jgi:hypothetical protein
LTRKIELKKIKRCMRLRKIGMCEVMKDKSMEDGLQHRDEQSALKENWRKTFMTQMVYEKVYV